MREMIPLLSAKEDKPKLSVVWLLNLPAGLLGFILQKYLGNDSLTRALMDQLDASSHASCALTSLYPQDVLTDARRLGVPLMSYSFRTSI